MNNIKVQVILGSVRDGRAGEKVLNWFKTQLPKSPDVDFEILDLKDWQLPYFHEAVPPSAAPGKYSDERSAEWARKIAEGDAYIIITPEYNRAIPASLKNAFDVPYSEWNHKPLAVVSYGGFVAGARASDQVKMIAIELQMFPIREEVNIPLVWQAFDEDGSLKDAEMHNKRAQAQLGHLIPFAKTLKEMRATEAAA